MANSEDWGPGLPGREESWDLTGTGQAREAGVKLLGNGGEGGPRLCGAPGVFQSRCLCGGGSIPAPEGLQRVSMDNVSQRPRKCIIIKEKRKMIKECLFLYIIEISVLVA